MSRNVSESRKRNEMHLPQRAILDSEHTLCECYVMANLKTRTAKWLYWLEQKLDALSMSSLKCTSVFVHMPRRKVNYPSHINVIKIDHKANLPRVWKVLSFLRAYKV